MRVLIFAGMEGVAGICRWEQVSAGRGLFEEGRRLYTEEVNAAERCESLSGTHGPSTPSRSSGAATPRW